MALPFAGMRVLSFCVGAVMPELTKIMGEFGADVIKIETEANVDLMRRTSSVPPPGGDAFNSNAGFNEANRSKRSLAINLKSDEGRKLMYRLIAQSDVVAENMRGGVMASLGVDYETVRAINPRIVYVSSQGFGASGPYRMYTTIGPTLSTNIGQLYAWSYPDGRTPIGASLAHPDHIAGKIGLTWVVAALDLRRRTGTGQFVDLSQSEAGASMMGEQYLEYTMNGREPARMGNRSYNAAPHGTYESSIDGRWCVLAVHNDEEWLGLREALGDPEWARDCRFGTLAERQRFSGEIDAHIQAWTRQRTPEEAMHHLQRHGVPSGPVQTAAELVEDPHLKARETFVEIDHPVVGKRLYPNDNLLRLMGTPAQPSVRAPLLGEHTDVICRELLGLSDAEIASLRESKVIGY